MAKYYMTLTLLLCLALQSNNIYARSHASAPAEASVTMRSAHPHPRHQPDQPAQHSSQPHTRQQRNRHPKHVAPDPNSEEEDEAVQRLQFEHKMRHKRMQEAHWLQQQQSYHRLHDDDEAEQPKHQPTVWELLGPSYGEELDYVNDAAADSEEDLLQSLPVVVPEPEPEPALNASKSTGGCPKCESHRQVEQISEEALRTLRIEFVKQQILEKLRLKESPNVAAVELPKPIFEGVTLAQSTETGKHKEYDDYYARTNQKFILLQREEVECRRLGNHPSMCFSFKIDDADADGFDVNTAVLWLFKNKQNFTKASNESEPLNAEQKKETIVVSELEQQLDSKYLPLARTIAIQSVDVQDEWMKINIDWPIKRWFGNHELSHLIQITCESCDIKSMEEIISVNKNYRPFIMIDTQNRRSKSRQRRSINCASGVTECCREKLYISFKDIGWDNWIIQPQGYDAYFCRGSCSSVASVAQAASHHSSLLKILSTNGARKPLDLVPCCTAKQYSSLQLVVLDSNNTATRKTLPNMIVESCGCR
ncbi:daw [Drosophila busckii]|uniref:Daw n=1 Tax=Drosophila busckii TaxID=30019 RepID=A0A0M5J422_DROBS|nr:inhibin beta A chain [Drosophila busckii]ALC39818.1 daw [Drosophila busckii]